VRAGTLTDDQLTKIRAVDKVKREVRKQTVEADLDGYRVLFVGGSGKKSVLESAAKRQDVVQYILVLLSDLLDSMCLPLSFPPRNVPSSIDLPLCQLAFNHDSKWLTCLVRIQKASPR